MCRPVVCAITAGDTPPDTERRHPRQAGDLVAYTRPTKEVQSQHLSLFIWYSGSDTRIHTFGHVQCLYPIVFVQLCNCSSSLVSDAWMDQQQGHNCKDDEARSPATGQALAARWRVLKGGEQQEQADKCCCRPGWGCMA
jgi:hypothetical protein